MTAFAALALKLAFGGWGLLKKLFELLWNIRLPAVITVAAVVLALIQMGEARHEKKLRHNAEISADLCAKARAADRKSYVDGQRAARELAEAEKRRTEQQYAQIQQEQSRENKARLDAANAQLREWMRNRAAQGSAGQAGVPRPSGSAAGPDAAASQTFMVTADDLEKCTAAVVRAESWAAWWTDIQKTQEGKR